MKIDGGLRKIFRERLPDFFWISIETGGTAGGVPDSHFVKNGRAAWVEYKWTKAWAIGLDPAQVAWHSRYAREGGLSFVAVRRQCEAGPRKTAADELLIFRGSAAAVLRAEGLRGPAVPLFQAAGGPSAWSWDEVRAVLLAS